MPIQIGEKTWNGDLKVSVEVELKKKRKKRLFNVNQNGQNFKY